MTIRRTTKTLLLAMSLLTWIATPASSEIIGLLESPSGFASQIANVQGWAYTTTPGAELIQPFDVLVDGEKIMSVPCCSDRLDVKGDDPAIPLLTGFSAVTNWAREAGEDPVVVQVLVTDTMGGSKLLTQSGVEVFGLASFPFSAMMEWAEVAGPLGGGGPLPSPIAARCLLSNSSEFTPGAAELTCTGVVATKGNLSETEMCEGTVRFSWDKASQGFKQTSNCEDETRWVDNLDGTITDFATGLMWEIKTTDGFNSVDLEFASCVDVAPADGACDFLRNNGPAYSEFLAFMNQCGDNGTDPPSGVAGGLAGYCDWRLPTVTELQGIADLTRGSCAGGSGPCLDPRFGPTGGSFTWTSTLSVASPGEVWAVDFNGGPGGVLVADAPGTLEFPVRLVRSW